MINTTLGNIGHLGAITAFVSAIVATIGYVWATQTSLSPLANTPTGKQSISSWRAFARGAFLVHAAALFLVFGVLFYIIYGQFYEYHYAWNHSSRNLPLQYMIACFWEGQEGSFLLWLIWQALLGLIIVRTNRFWENPVMAVVMAVQIFLASMILGIVVFGFKFGSSPFMLMRDAMPDIPVFQVGTSTYNPNFIPPDGKGLNALLQNYWMVIHPPTLFLGFALTLVPFAYCLAGLWVRQYREWVRPALPWALVGGAVLGLGILMGGYWAYETLNFGGYWNWDPVENAVYVPWLVLIAAIHTMVINRTKNTALTTSMILCITTFLLILYSTFLTRSGILGNASVHSFTDLGLSGQLLVYLLVFVVAAIVLLAIRWREIPKSKEEMSVYGREFWIFVGAVTLCLAGFQVLATTSIPVANKIAEALGSTMKFSAPADAIAHYSKFQLWGAVLIALLSGTGQLFLWKNMDKEQIQKAFALPVIITLLVSALWITLAKIQNISYIILLTASLYTIVANGGLLVMLLSRKNFSLSGGAVSHIGVGLMLVGILFSSGYSNTVSKNKSGTLIFDPKNAETLEQKKRYNEENADNVLLWFNEPTDMREYKITYKGDYVQGVNFPYYIKKTSLQATNNARKPIALENIAYEGKQYFKKGDSVAIYPENTFYRIEYRDQAGKVFSLYPRAQVNPSMGGLLASPDILHGWGADLYTHVSSVPDPDKEKKWTKKQDFKAKLGDTLFINDMVAVFEKHNLLSKEELGRFFTPQELAEKNCAGLRLSIRVLGKTQAYYVRPLFVAHEKNAAFIPDEIPELGLRLALTNIDTKTEQFSFEVFQGQRDYVVLKATEKPLINVLWVGTLVLMLGFSIAVYRRYQEFVRMRNKGLETK